jgi:hypothetical protein
LLQFYNAFPQNRQNLGDFVEPLYKMWPSTNIDVVRQVLRNEIVRKISTRDDHARTSNANEKIGSRAALFLVALFLATVIACGRIAAVRLLTPNLLCICQRQSPGPGETRSGVRGVLVQELHFRLDLKVTCMNPGFLHRVKGAESSS